MSRFPPARGMIGIIITVDAIELVTATHAIWGALNLGKDRQFRLYWLLLSVAVKARISKSHLMLPQILLLSHVVALLLNGKPDLFADAADASFPLAPFPDRAVDR